MPSFPHPPLPPLPPLIPISQAYHVPMDPHIHLRSSWRDAIGKPLTNGIIRNRIKQGFYGEEAKLVEFKKVESKTGFIERCCVEACGQKLGVRFLKFKYLPKNGFYCEVHRALFREQSAKDAEQEKEINSRLKQARISIEDFV